MPDTDGGTASAKTGASNETGEQEEIERLRAELATLRSQLPPSGFAPAAHPRGRWRAPVAIVLVVLGCLLAPLSVLGVWTANQVSDTNRYIANIEPLIHEPAIQNELTNKVTGAITGRLNVAGYTKQAATELSSHGLPRIGTLLHTFSPSITSAVNGFVRTRVNKLVTGPKFAHAWLQVNTIAHTQVVKALSGQGGGPVTTSNGKVTVDLTPFVNAAKQDLASNGLTLVNKLPPIHPSLELFSSRKLVQAQTGYRLLNDLKIVLPILSLLLIGMGVYITRGHRRALIGAGLGFAASMLVLAIGLAIFRGIYLNSVPSSVLSSDAAAALFDTLVRFIKQALRVLLLVGLVVAAGAFLTGPSVTAVRTRGTLRSGLGWIRESGEHLGLRTGPVGRWTYAHRKGLRIGAVSLAALIFVFWGRPTAAVVILIVVLLLVVLGLIELLGRPPAQPEMSAQGAGG
jgi:hypothetical protein